MRSSSTNSGYTGKGSIKKMKDRLEAHVTEAAKSMFSKCSRLLGVQLKNVRMEINALKDAIIEDITQEVLEGFLGRIGRAFYRAEDSRNERIILKKQEECIVDVVKRDDGNVEVVPFRRGQKTWSLSWK